MTPLEEVFRGGRSVNQPVPLTEKLRSAWLQGCADAQQHSFDEIAPAISVVMNGLGERMERTPYLRRMAHLEEQNIAADCWVQNRHGKILQVVSVTADGYLRLKGRRGSFNPYVHYFVRVEKTAETD